MGVTSDLSRLLLILVSLLHFTNGEESSNIGGYLTQRFYYDDLNCNGSPSRVVAYKLNICSPFTGNSADGTSNAFSVSYYTVSTGTTSVKLRRKLYADAACSSFHSDDFYDNTEVKLACNQDTSSSTYSSFMSTPEEVLQQFAPYQGMAVGVHKDSTDCYNNEPFLYGEWYASGCKTKPEGKSVYAMCYDSAYHGYIQSYDSSFCTGTGQTRDFSLSCGSYQSDVMSGVSGGMCTGTTSSQSPSSSPVMISSAPVMMPGIAQHEVYFYQEIHYSSTCDGAPVSAKAYKLNTCMKYQYDMSSPVYYLMYSTAIENGEIVLKQRYFNDTNCVYEMYSYTWQNTKGQERCVVDGMMAKNTKILSSPDTVMKQFEKYRGTAVGVYGEDDCGSSGKGFLYGQWLSSGCSVPSAGANADTPILSATCHNNGAYQLQYKATATTCSLDEIYTYWDFPKECTWKGLDAASGYVQSSCTGEKGEDYLFRYVYHDTDYCSNIPVGMQSFKQNECVMKYEMGANPKMISVIYYTDMDGIGRIKLMRDEFHDAQCYVPRASINFEGIVGPNDKCEGSNGMSHFVKYLDSSAAVFAHVGSYEGASTALYATSDECDKRGDPVFVQWQRAGCVSFSRGTSMYGSCLDDYVLLANYGTSETCYGPSKVGGESTEQCSAKPMDAAYGTSISTCTPSVDGYFTMSEYYNSASCEDSPSKVVTYKLNTCMLFESDEGVRSSVKYFSVSLRGNWFLLRNEYSDTECKYMKMITHFNKIAGPRDQCVTNPSSYKSWMITIHKDSDEVEDMFSEYPGTAQGVFSSAKSCDEDEGHDIVYGEWYASGCLHTDGTSYSVKCDEKQEMLMVASYKSSDTCSGADVDYMRRSTKCTPFKNDVLSGMVAAFCTGEEEDLERYFAQISYGSNEQCKGAPNKVDVYKVKTCISNTYSDGVKSVKYYVKTTATEFMLMQVSFSDDDCQDFVSDRNFDEMRGEKGCESHGDHSVWTGRMHDYPEIMHIVDDIPGLAVGIFGDEGNCEDDEDLLYGRWRSAGCTGAPGGGESLYAECTANSAFVKSFDSCEDCKGSSKVYNFDRTSCRAHTSRMVTGGYEGVKCTGVRDGVFTLKIFPNKQCEGVPDIVAAQKLNTCVSMNQKGVFYGTGNIGKESVIQSKDDISIKNVPSKYFRDTHQHATLEPMNISPVGSMYVKYFVRHDEDIRLMYFMYSDEKCEHPMGSGDAMYADAGGREGCNLDDDGFSLEVHIVHEIEEVVRNVSKLSGTLVSIYDNSLECTESKEMRSLEWYAAGCRSYPGFGQSYLQLCQPDKAYSAHYYSSSDCSGAATFRNSYPLTCGLYSSDFLSGGTAVTTCTTAPPSYLTRAIYNDNERCDGSPIMVESHILDTCMPFKMQTAGVAYRSAKYDLEYERSGKYKLMQRLYSDNDCKNMVSYTHYEDINGNKGCESYQGSSRLSLISNDKREIGKIFNQYPGTLIKHYKSEWHCERKRMGGRMYLKWLASGCNMIPWSGGSLFSSCSSQSAYTTRYEGSTDCPATATLHADTYPLTCTTANGPFLTGVAIASCTYSPPPKPSMTPVQAPVQVPRKTARPRHPVKLVSRSPSWGPRRRTKRPPTASNDDGWW
eukprot:CAMPEP_0182416588 /NCGR_PEP_ID=MMETSP1167-20130531/945_1 /TAXON_ID=2988 /ORGANISM="Mallomonas Sp, Strain CCMP3275" /LENGTH=1612 /DNA_ID=CAMNT_0024589517 /DNA_START=37 /DNA_END=4875 /DNA_ORIENTATION=+